MDHLSKSLKPERRNWNETSTIMQKTRYVEFRNPYVKTARQQEGNCLFLEKLARSKRGNWRKSTFSVAETAPLDLEIGTGNGEFLAHYAAANPRRYVLGIERKYKPLMQSLKRIYRGDLENAAVLRYWADYLEEIFEPQEINDIFLFFPDPWPKKKHHKNRLVNADFFKSTFALQRPQSFFTIKTDDDDYYEWILRFAQQSQYRVVAQTTDLHNSPLGDGNFMTQFERLWTSKGLKTKYLRLQK